MYKRAVEAGGALGGYWSSTANACTLPLTGKRVVNRIITELCVFDVLPDGAGLEMIEIADLMARALRGRDDDEVIAAVRADVNALCARFPVYGG